MLKGHCITEQIKYNLLILLKWRNLVEVPHRWTNLERPCCRAALSQPNLPDLNSTTTALHNAASAWASFQSVMHPSLAWSCPEVSVTAFYGPCMHACMQSVLSVSVSHTAHTPRMWNLRPVSPGINRLSQGVWKGRLDSVAAEWTCKPFWPLANWVIGLGEWILLYQALLEPYWMLSCWSVRCIELRPAIPFADWAAERACFFCFSLALGNVCCGPSNCGSQLSLSVYGWCEMWSEGVRVRVCVGKGGVSQSVSQPLAVIRDQRLDLAKQTLFY